MPNHIQITFHDLQPEQQDVLIAHLAEAGYEGFEENDNELKAFIPEDHFDKSQLNELVFKYQLQYSEKLIAEQNWNALWESNFQPVVVDDFALKAPWVGIRADFHEPIKDVQHEIIITPKMSFGTGHHATTYMMVQQMRDIDFSGRKVFDFGTGTGVLAILAEKLGAAYVLAIDNDEWSIDNATENCQRNNCRHIQMRQADTAAIGDSFDIILANINKNVILDNLSLLTCQVKKGGVLLLSGLLAEDEADILTAMQPYALQQGKTILKNNWISLRFNG